ncbi:MAG: pseudouridine synthase [Bacteroidia bacterium]|nr:pseudouridine synthase [Bacteroidia bacterium]
MLSFLIYKPFGVVSQFTEPVPGKRTLADLFDFPKDVYPVGRLDEDSEGLLLLTNDARQNQRLLGQGVEKEYWVQVEGIPEESALERLRKGVSIRVNKKDFLTAPALVRTMDAPDVPGRVPPIRVRLSVPDCWVAITIREGKNRQVRRMTAAIGHPTLRLLRWRLGNWTIDGMAPGDVKQVKL